MDEAQLKSELQKYFGYTAFKEGQLEPVQSVFGRQAHIGDSADGNREILDIPVEWLPFGGDCRYRFAAVVFDGRSSRPTEIHG